MSGTLLKFSKVLPGAMQRTVAGDFTPQVEVLSTQLVGNELVLQVVATNGLTWAVSAHQSLSGLVATGQTFVGSGSTQEVRIPVPVGRDKFFVQITQE